MDEPKRNMHLKSLLNRIDRRRIANKQIQVHHIEMVAFEID